MPKGPQGQKRPADVIGAAIKVAQIATGEIEEKIETGKEYDLAKKCDLNIILHDCNSEIWKLIWQIYVRLNYVVMTTASKVIESSTDSYAAPPPPNLE